MRLLFVGHNGERAVTGDETRKQIDAVKALECALVDSEGNALTWEVFDDPNEERSLFQAIELDRRVRIDDHILMANRPAIAVITEAEGKAVRLEFYAGHDALSIQHDIRSAELQGVDLPVWLEVDPQAYDPAAFLEKLSPELVESLGGVDAVREFLQHIHQEAEDA